MLGADYQIKKPTQFYDQLQLKLSRVSRENVLYPYKKGDKATFGLAPAEVKRITHSNLTTVGASVKKGLLVVMGEAGYDIANQSLYGKLGFSINHVREGPWGTMLQFSLEGAQIWGKNILKNDYFYRNRCTWPGNKSTNFLSPRAEMHFLNYPGLSLLKFTPYLYLQGWANSRKPLVFGHGKVTVEGDYGLGLTIGTNSKIDLSLLNVSVEREGRAWGAVKFSFFE